MDSTAVHYALATGNGLPIKQNIILQDLCEKWYKIKAERGHTLVTLWVTSMENLADPLSWGLLAT